MKTAAVICEYNPFHNGHKYQLDTARKMTGCDGVVALMSGSFVQRGDFAIYPKEVRAEAALKNGADLVIENPAVFTLRSAEGYADAAIYTLSKFNCIEYLFFGAECKELEKLETIAELFVCETDEFKAVLATELSKGLAFATARSRAAARMLGAWVNDVLKEPNNLLAIEYLKAIKRQNSSLKPVLIQRKGVGHNSGVANGEYASASFIREELLKQNNLSTLVPRSAFECYKNVPVFNSDAAEKAIISALSLMPPEIIVKAPDISEGLENKIKTEVMKNNSLDGLISAVKSKRYAYSRIKRALLCAYLKIDESDAKMVPQYIKPLMFNQAGQSILSSARKKAELPLAKSASPILKNEKAMQIWKRELEFERVYRLFYC